MFDNDLVTTFAVKGNLASQQLVENDPKRVDVDLATVLSTTNLGGHVVKRADAFGMSASMRRRNEFAQSVVANFDNSQIIKNIAGL